MSLFDILKTTNIDLHDSDLTFNQTYASCPHVIPFHKERISFVRRGVYYRDREYVYKDFCRSSLFSLEERLIDYFIQESTIERLRLLGADPDQEKRQCFNNLIWKYPISNYNLIIISLDDYLKVYSADPKFVFNYQHMDSFDNSNTGIAHDYRGFKIVFVKKEIRGILLIDAASFFIHLSHSHYGTSDYFHTTHILDLYGKKNFVFYKYVDVEGLISEYFDV